MRGNTCAQVYVTPFHFVKCFPMVGKADAPATLTDFFKDPGIPASIILDNAKELTKGDFKWICRRAQCPITPVEAYTPNRNEAEAAIRETKRHFTKTMIDTAAPEILWDY